MSEDNVSKDDFDGLAKDMRGFFRQYDLDMRGDMDTSEDGRGGIVSDVRLIRRIQEKYPSITYLFAHKPLPTIMVVIGIFLVLYGSLYLGVLTMIGQILGLDMSSVPPLTH